MTRKIAALAAGAFVTLGWVMVAFAEEGVEAPADAPVDTRWFVIDRTGYLVTLLLMAGALFYYTYKIRRRPQDVFIRRIPGVDAIEEAVGRATEMGRPVLYVTGVEETQNIQTVASLLILGHVAEMTAQYDSDIKVANAYPLTMVLAEEMVSAGYARAGRIDAHKPENVLFITPEQFAFAAGVNGIILRDRPATNIFLGRFFAESLILAETGYVTQAVQIAGTAEITQLPFFVAACDYALLGEELYAVSAYLTREPSLLSQLKSSDFIKALSIAVIIIGVIANSFFGWDLGAVFFPMKKTLPMLLGCVVGLLVIAEFFSQRFGLPFIREELLLPMAQILAAFAYILGGINLIQVNAPTIRRREAGWGYKLVMLVGAAGMLLVGLKWQNIGEDPSPGTVSITGTATPEVSAPARIRVIADNPHAVVRIDGGAPMAALVDGKPLEIEVEPGKHAIQVSMPLPVAGHLALEKDFEVAAGQVAVAEAPLPMLFGPEGRVYSWLYNYVFAPCNSTMFALLAFFIASAAFRAFRARNTEAMLLLGAAIIVLLGRAPIGAYISQALPDLTNWIIDIPNNAGRRALVMGAALGAIATGLRIVLGIERSHLGSD